MAKIPEEEEKDEEIEEGHFDRVREYPKSENLTAKTFSLPKPLVKKMELLIAIGEFVSMSDLARDAFRNIVDERIKMIAGELNTIITKILENEKEAIDFTKPQIVLMKAIDQIMEERSKGKVVSK